MSTFEGVEQEVLDDLDVAILSELQENCRTSNADLGRRLHLSPPAIHARIRRLEETGVIARYAAILDREKVGFDMLCFVHVGLHFHQDNQVRAVRQALAALPEVLECFHVTGTDDYLLKVAVRNRRELEHFVGTVTPIPGVARIQTSLVLGDVKCEPSLPIGHAAPGAKKRRRKAKR